LSFAARRLAQAVPLLLIISLLVFGLIHAAPGGPLSLYLDNPNVRPEDIERLKRAMGLDKPLGTQYVSWLASFVRGDWGYSYTDGRPVTERMLERVPATLQLVGISTVLAVLVSVAVGVGAALRRGVDQAASIGAVAGLSVPVFWLGLVLQLLFSNTLGWLPSSGRASFVGGGLADRLAHLVLPVTVLALAQPFAKAARARGVTETRIVLRHALRHALLPFATVVLLDASIMASGAVVTESVFAWPGIGSLFTEALAKRDYTVLMAFLMCASVAVVTLSFLADVAVHALDPRTRDAS